MNTALELHRVPPPKKTPLMSDAIAELSMGSFCVTRSNPTHQMTDPTQPNSYKWKNLDPTQPNTTNNGAYSLVVTYFIHITFLVLLVDQASTYSCSLLIIIHIRTVSLCHSKPCSKYINMILSNF